MAHRQSRAPTILSLVLLLGLACKDSPTVPGSGEKGIGTPRKLMTAEDSAAYFASRPPTAAAATTTAVTAIALKAGDSIVVSITSYECSGNPETVTVYGVISGVVAAGSCDGGLTGIQMTMGPASADGTIYFTATHQVYGEGPAGQVSGAPPTYTVGLDDGAGDFDYNDVILSVHLLSTDPRLDCTPNPQRGATVTCTAWGSGVAVTGWSFTGPSYNGQATHNLTGPSSGNTWEGPAVASGTVSAQVAITGIPRPAPLTANFAVQNRTEAIWHWQKARDWSYSQGTAMNCGQGNFRYNEYTILGWNARKGTCDGAVVTPDPQSFPNSGYSIQAVTAGPNVGLSYVTSVSYRIDTESNINNALTAGSPIVYQLVDKTEKRDCNKGGAGTTVNFFNFNTKCRKLDLAPFFTGLWFHEGYGRTNNSGHQAQLEIAASLPGNDLYALVEHVFGEGESNTRSAIVTEAATVTRGLVSAFADHTNVNNNYSGTVWRWNLPTSAFLSSFVTF